MDVLFIYKIWFVLHSNYVFKKRVISSIIRDMNIICRLTKGELSINWLFVNEMKYSDFLNKWQDIAAENEKEESAILLLLLAKANMSSAQLYINMDNEIPLEISNSFEEDVKRYLYNNEPVQYIIGTACFYGYDFDVTPNVLIPRPETEELVENVLYLYDDYFKGQMVDVVDVGTGSGCISVTLAAEEKNMKVTATDISDEALKIASSNASKMNVDVTFYQGDMLKPIMDKKFDILVSNPPYIPDNEIVDSLVKDNEPNVALFGGTDGLKFYRVILENAPKIMREKCILAFEHGYNKTFEIEDLCRKYFPEAKVFTKKDLQGLDRMTFVIRGFSSNE